MSGKGMVSMMKRTISLLMAFLLCMVLPLSVGASEPDGSQPVANVEQVLISRAVTQLENGDYIVEEVFQDVPLVQTFASGSRTGNKSVGYYDANNVLRWTLTVRGAFFYTGVSASCVDSDYTVSIQSSAWSFVSGSSSCSNNQAIAVATAKTILEGHKTIRAILTCDSNGKLS